MSRSPGQSRSHLNSHTHSRNRAPSLYARFLVVALLAIAGSPVLPFLSVNAQEKTEPQKSSDESALREQIAERVEQLADSAYSVREQAGRALVEYGSAALPELRRALGSTDAEVRRRAEELIGEIARQAQRLEEQAESRLPQLDRLRRELPELTDPAFDAAVRRLDRIFDQFDQFSPPNTERLRMRMGDFDRQFEERIAELEERMRRSFERLDGARDGLDRRSIEKRLFGEDGFDSFFGRDSSKRSRVQIWRDGEQVFDSERTFELSTIAELGVALETLHPALRSHLPIPAGVGLLVGEVLPRAEANADGTPAESSLHAHDILLKINDQPVTDVRGVRQQLRAIDGIAPLRVELLRGGRIVEKRIPIAVVR